ncbi:TPA: Rab family GTPase [Legionella anisa]
MSSEPIEKNEKRPLRILLLGHSGSGKTQLHMALEGKKYHPAYYPSMGMEFSTFKSELDFEITVLPGGERFRYAEEPEKNFIQSLLPGALKRSDLNILCIDPSDKEAYKKAAYYAKEIRQIDPKAPIIIAFTQLDKKLGWKISDQEIQNFKNHFGITALTIGTSAIQGEEGIKELRAVTYALERQIFGEKAELETTLSLNDIKLNIENFYQLARAGLAELEKGNKQYLKSETALPPQLQAPLNAVQGLVEQLEKTRDLSNKGQISETTLFNAYKQAVDHFVHEASNDVLKVNPPQNIMHVILRLLRAPFIGFHMYNDTELKELHRIEQQANFKEELQKMKEQENDKLVPERPFEQP